MRRLLALGLGHAGARLVSAPASLIFALVSGPEAFALFGPYLAGLALVQVALFLRYETAVGTAGDDRAALGLTGLCLLIGLPVVALAGLGAGFLFHIGGQGAGLGLLFAVSLAGRGVIILGVAHAGRDGRFEVHRDANLVQALAQPALLFAFYAGGLDAVTALCLADAAGHVVGAAYSAHAARLLARLRGLDLASLPRLALAWVSLPVYALPAAFLAHATAHAPLLALPLLADANLAGVVVLAYRLLDMPGQVAGSLAGPMIQQRWRRMGQGCDVPAFALALVAVLTAAGGVIALLDAAFLTGTGFEGVGRAALPMVGLPAAAIIAQVALALAPLAGRERALLVLNAMALASAGLLVMLTRGDAMAMVAALSANGVVHAGLLAASLARPTAPTPAVAMPLAAAA